MGCGSERSDWDDKAVQDSLAGKNTELDPRIQNEAKEFREAKEILREKTSGFEQLKDKDGKSIITTKEVIKTVVMVELAREMIKPTEHMKVLEIRFKNVEDGFRGRSFNLEDEKDHYTGNIIEIHAGEIHNNPAEVKHTVFHEIGETYFNQVLANKDTIGEDKTKQNIEKWESFLADIVAKNAGNPELYPLNRIEKEAEEKAVPEHFGQCFARYSLAVLEDKMEHNQKATEGFKQLYPGQSESFEKMLEEFKQKG